MLALQTSPVLPEYASSAEIVESDDDLLTEILLRMPVRSLFRSKLVSKRWLSLVSDPYFFARRNPSRCRPSGLIGHLFSKQRTTPFERIFFPFDIDHDESIDKPQELPPPLSNMNILNSCNGLLTCYTHCHYHVYNPTTRQFVTVLNSNGTVGSEIRGLYLAFDPSESAHYRVVCLWYTRNDDFQIEVYSSETHRWRSSGESFYRVNSTNFNIGVYWNGAINWIDLWLDSLYFNLDDERLGNIPMVAVRDETHTGSNFRYFGESNGHLHFVEMGIRRTIRFSVYEMKRDYSEWFVKYSVDLDGIAAAFPAIIPPNHPPDYIFSILSIVRGDEEEEESSFMVLQTPGKAIRYNFIDHSFVELCDLGPAPAFGFFHYFESMASV